MRSPAPCRSPEDVHGRSVLRPGTGTILLHVVVDEGLWDTVKALGNLAKDAYEAVTGATEDDFVGIVKEINIECYVFESGPVWHALPDDEATYAVYVMLDNTDDVDREMCDPESFEPVTVSISGPTEIPPSASEGCGYDAFADGGAGLNTYEWKWDGNVVGTESTWVPGACQHR